MMIINAITLLVASVFFKSSVFALGATLNAKAWQSVAEYPTAKDFPEEEFLSSKPSSSISFTGF
jgi:hypothetical protein